MIRPEPANWRTHLPRLVTRPLAMLSIGLLWLGFAVADLIDNRVP